MFLIIGHHFSLHGGFGFDINYVDVTSLWIQIIKMGGKIGVNIFVLISGYFLIDSHGVSIKKVYKLLMQVLFYAIVIYLICIGLQVETFSVDKMLEALFPISHEVWWFISAYLVLYLLSPYINILLKNLDKRQYQKLLLLCFLGWCLSPTLGGYYYQSNNLLWFSFLYAIAGYVKIYGLKKEFSAVGYFLTALISGIVMISIFLIISRWSEHFNVGAGYIAGTQTLPVLMISVSLFLGFKNLKIGCMPWVNTIASAVFGVYLLHDNPYIRYRLWYGIRWNYPENMNFILYSAMAMLAVYIVCTVIDLIRIYTIEKIAVRVYDFVELKLRQK